jgi:hypothetical protein
MRAVPRNTTGKIEFYKLRLAKWAEHAEQLGLTEQLVAELADATEAAREADRAQRAAAQAARAATQIRDNAIEKMATLGATMIKQIRVQAERQGQQTYSLALMSPPEKPSPLGAPGEPYAFTFELGQTGWLTLRFKCKNPRGSVGTMYHVSRRINLQGKFEYLGSAGETKFIDTSLPAGATSVEYKVQAVRSTAAGPAGRYSINLCSSWPSKGEPKVYVKGSGYPSLFAA